MTRTTSKRWCVLSAAVVMGLGGLVIGPANVAQARVPTNGRIAFYSDRDVGDNVYVMDVDGANVTRLTNVSGQHGAPSWSPDGTKIAFHSTRDDVTGGNAEIYVMDADGTNQTRLTDTTAANAWPAWSPDGTKIAFESRRDGNWEIYVMNADGTNQTRLTTNSAFDDYPAWSPNGTQIAFTSSRAGPYQIYVMNADGIGQTRISNTSTNDSEPAWSPDGSKIAFESTRSGDYEIYVMNTDGSNQTVLTNSFRSVSAAWSPDGTRIAYATFNLAINFWQIYTMKADGTDPINITNITKGNFGPDWGVEALPVDTTPPTVVCDVPAPQFVLGQSGALVSATVTDEVGGSGALTSPVSQPADVNSVGSKTVDLSGFDVAGNSTTTACPYTVVYQANQEEFFFAPVDNDAMNQAKAGQVIPVRWRITDADGTPITNLTTVTVTWSSMSCAAEAVDAIEEYAATAGASGLQNLGDGYYQYNLKTSKAWTGTCRTVRLDLGEGITHTAQFRFVK